MNAILCLFYFFTCAQVLAQRWLVVETEHGQVNGVLLQTNQKQYSGFLGIPYAKPPRRFEVPEPPTKWGGVKETIRYQPACPHKDYRLNRVVGNEDCLYLNVFSPSNNPGNGFEIVSYPVVVFIHGPDYTTGSGSVYGADYFIDKNIVVVTFNFRLGVLGFMSTGDNSSPGNFALHDQNLALKWVKNNIGRFRGDPNKITLIGQGAGAAMVSIHMMSPLSRGLFQRAITESGNALCDWAVDENPRENSADYTEKLGKLLNCGSGLTNTDLLVRCLRTRLVTELIETQDKLMGFGVFPGVWKPVIDSNQNNKSRVFISDSPKVLVARNSITGGDLITGINKNEGSMLYFYMMKFASNIVFDEFFLERNLIPSFLGNLTNLYGPAVVREIMNKYFRGINTKDSREVVKIFTEEMVTDALFVGCNEKWAEEHLQSRIYSPGNNPQVPHNTYKYVFTYKGKNSFVDRERYALRVAKQFDTGVSNRDELLYLWNLKFLNFTQLSSFDTEIRNRMLTMWSEFVRGGLPIRVAGREYRPWFSLQSSPTSYYDIGRDLMDRNSYKLQETQLWNDELPKISTIRTTTPFPTNTPLINGRLSTENEPYKTATWAMLAIVIALIILCVFLCCMLLASKRKREFKAEPDVYH